MLSPHKQLICFLVLASGLSACGRAPKSFDVQRPVKQEPISVRTQSVNAIAVADGAVQTRRDEQIVFLVAASHNEEQPHRHREPRSDSQSVAATDLPPDYVIQRESGGSYTAYNPNGCADFCYGRYQFSSDWGGKLGLPEDIRQATPEQQDEAARQLWAGGAGCSNWDACN